MESGNPTNPSPVEAGDQLSVPAEQSGGRDDGIEVAKRFATKLLC